MFVVRLLFVEVYFSLECLLMIDVLLPSTLLQQLPHWGFHSDLKHRSSVCSSFNTDYKSPVPKVFFACYFMYMLNMWHRARLYEAWSTFNCEYNSSEFVVNGLKHEKALVCCFKRSVDVLERAFRIHLFFLFSFLFVNSRKEQGEPTTRFVTDVSLNIHCIPFCCRFILKGSSWVSNPN